jgi:hypothetical protein
MNKYFKLDDDEEVFITSDNFAEEAIVYMDKVGLGNCDEFLEDLERLHIAEEVANPTVDECFNIIQNLMDIAEYVVGYEDPIVYFDKALNVMTDELQMAMDFNERHEYTWNMTTDFVTEDNANFWYAKEIIAGSLNKIFTIKKESSKELLKIYKEVTMPIYTTIKKIVIDEVEFRNIKDAQSYINTQIFLEVESVYDDEGIFSPIHMVVSDELEVFEITLDMTDAFDAVGCLQTTLIDGIISVVDELFPWNESDYIIKGEVPQAKEYEFDLYHYKDEAITIVDLSFLYQDIYNDVTKHLKKHNMYFDNEQVIDFAFSTLKDAYKYQIKYDSSLEDKYLMLKYLAVDNFSYKLKKYYHFDEYRVDKLERYGMYDLEKLLEELKNIL